MTSPYFAVLMHSLLYPASTRMTRSVC